jgi:hypothetical protein
MLSTVPQLVQAPCHGRAILNSNEIYQLTNLRTYQLQVFQLFSNLPIASISTLSPIADSGFFNPNTHPYIQS